MSDPDYTIPVSQTGNSSQNSNAEYGYKVFSPGDVVGKKYQILQELGSGGFATTYLAEINNETRRKCVIKQLQPRFNSPAIWENARERLGTEGMVLQWLGKHDQIPELIDHFDENGQFYLILEFIEGEEFDREVQRELLTENQVVSFLYDVLNILTFVHQQGVIHRDIKPSNLIRRRKDGKIALIDFGAVKEIGTAIFESPEKTLQTQVIGTPGYMPPEQNNGKPLFSSDLYALGKTAIYGLTGRSPVDWEEIETNEMISWYEKTTISQQLSQIIRRMTSPKTSERYHSAQEVLADITPLLKVGTTVNSCYLIISYLGGEKNIDSYLVKDIQESGYPLFYLRLLRPENKNVRELEKIKEALEQEIPLLNKVYEKQEALKILQSFIWEDYVCLIQEYVEGYNISQLINRKSSLSEEHTIDILIDSLVALKICHKHKVIHGNIQPLSLFKKRGTGKVILQNFGEINCFANNFLNSNLGYTPPEQIAGRITNASDIYALGMTAIHCLTGTVPQRLNISNQTGSILWEENVKVNPDLAKIINKMVCLERKKRYSSAERVLKDIKKLKKKNQKKSLFAYIIFLPVLIGISLFILSQWAQRAAILEFYNGDLRLEKKQYQKAIELFNHSIKNQKEDWADIHSFVYLGLCEYELGNYKKAITQFQRAVKITPS